MILDLTKRLVEDIQDALHKEGSAKMDSSQLRSLIQAALQKCNLVTREEYDAQVAVVLKTREKLEDLEAQVQELQSRLDKAP